MNKITPSQNEVQAPVIESPRGPGSVSEKVKVFYPFQDSSEYTIRERMEREYFKYPNKLIDKMSTGAWCGRRCFITAGGESLRGFDYSRLDGQLTIGINRSFEFYSPTMLYSMDTRFYDWVRHGVLDSYDKSAVLQKWESYNGFKVFLCPMNFYDFSSDTVYMIRRVLDEAISLDLEQGIYGGNNSGFGAIMLAMALGADPIYLLGYDMKMEKRTHCHSGYPGQGMANLWPKIEAYRALLEAFAPRIKDMGFRIINLNPDSALCGFEFDTVDNVLPQM